MRKKVLLALIVAGEILGSQNSVESREIDSVQTDHVIDGLLKQTQCRPEMRAYYLLTIAGGFIAGLTQREVDSQYFYLLTSTAQDPRLPRWWERNLSDLADKVCRSQSRLATFLKSSPETKQKISKESTALANQTLLQALSLVDIGVGPFAKLNAYLIASKYFQDLQNQTEKQRCETFLNEAFKACETGPVDEAQIKAAVSVLNSMAYGFVPIHVQDRLGAIAPYRFLETEPTTEESFKRAKSINYAQQP